MVRGIAQAVSDPQTLPRNRRGRLNRPPRLRLPFALVSCPPAFAPPVRRPPRPRLRLRFQKPMASRRRLDAGTIRWEPDPGALEASFLKRSPCCHEPGPDPHPLSWKPSAAPFVPVCVFAFRSRRPAAGDRIRRHCFFIDNRWPLAENTSEQGGRVSEPLWLRWSVAVDFARVCFPGAVVLFAAGAEFSWALRQPPLAPENSTPAAR